MLRQVNQTPNLPQGSVPAESVALARFDLDLIQALYRELSDHAQAINLLVTRPTFRFSKGSNQTGIVSGVATQITFDTLSWNDGGYYNTGANRWIPPIGKYILVAAVANAGNNHTDQGSNVLMIYRNGVLHRTLQNITASGANGLALSGVCHVNSTNGTDYFEVFASYNTTANWTALSGAANTWFSGAAV